MLRRVGVVAALLAAVTAGFLLGSVSTDRSTAAPENYGRQITQLRRDVVRLKRAEGNLCVFFRHPPQVDDLALRGWFQQVGAGCDAFGLR